MNSNSWLIVGGGVFGLSTALKLRNLGHDVIVFDRIAIASAGGDAASNDINKVVRPDYGDDVLYQDLALKSIDIFKDWNRTSAKPVYHEVGATFLTVDPNMNDFERASAQSLRSAGKAASLVPVTAAAHPALATALKSMPYGYNNLGAGYANAASALAHLRALCLAAGVKILEGEAGHVTEVVNRGVVTPRVTVRGHAVLVAAGSWSAALLPELRELIRPVGQPVVHLRPPVADAERLRRDLPVWFADITNTGYYGFPPNEDGIVKVANHGPGYASRTFHSAVLDASRGAELTPPEIPVESVLAYRRFFEKCFPEFNKLDIVKTRICWYCDSFDGNFIIDKLPNREGVFVATGGSGHAFKFAPVLGDLVSEMVLSGKPHPRFALSRAPKAGADAIRGSGAIPKALEDAVMASKEDLTAEAFASGRVHGGAWSMPDDIAAASKLGLERALQRGIELFRADPGTSAVDLAQAIIRVLEDDTTFDAGSGSFLNREGEVEMDSLIATDDLKMGMVAGVRTVKNPIDLARAVRDKGGDGCIFIGGQGCDAFAKEVGLETVAPETLVHPRERALFEKLKREGGGGGKAAFEAPAPEGVAGDTVGCIVRDAQGVVCVALSTGGTPMKRRGRIGDTPLWGCGGYARNGRAAAATGFGEDLTRVVMSKSAVDRLGRGLGAMRAAEEQVEELLEVVRGRGGVIILAEDGPGVAFNTPRMAYGWVDLARGEDIVVGVEPEDLERDVKRL